MLHRLLSLASTSFRRNRRPARQPRVLPFQPRLEGLEERTLPATVLWTNASGGDWSTASKEVIQNNLYDFVILALVSVGNSIRHETCPA